MTDTSDSVMVAVLKQLQSGKWAPLKFWSRKLQSVELNYSCFDKELLATFSVVKHFCHLLEGRQFELRLKYKPVVQALVKQSQRDNPQQARQLAYISKFDILATYLLGLENTVADCLSRAAVSIVSSPSSSASVSTISSPSASAPSRSSFITEQKACQETLALQSSNALKVSVESDGLLVDSSTGGRCVLVPWVLRQAVLSAIHGLHHPGVRTTQRLVATSYVWSRMRADMAAFVRDCNDCNKAKIGVLLK